MVFAQVSRWHQSKIYCYKPLLKSFSALHSLFLSGLEVVASFEVHNGSCHTIVLLHYLLVTAT